MMKLQLLSFYDTLMESFWFLPAFMALVSTGAALGSVSLDHALGSQWVSDMSWVWSGSANGARSVLSTVAGSIMTVISIVFSLTLSTLAQTSSHFGPRVMRNFTSDRSNQFVLGTFISTFIYCLLVLRTVRSVEESTFVPYISVNIGIGLSLASLAVLIYFIHHITQTIQAENLIAAVGNDFQRHLSTFFPERIGSSAKKGDTSKNLGDLSWENSSQVCSLTNGYIQRIDDQNLMRLAEQHGLLIKLEKRPGDFISGQSPFLRVLPPIESDSGLERALCRCFSIGNYRTPHQDTAYSLQQLTEVAARALSPGINEPFTAITCIDWLGASLRGVAQRDLPEAIRCDSSGNMRVIAPPLSFEDLVGLSFDAIRLYGADNVDILIHLLKTISELATHLQREDDMRVLMHQVELINLDTAQIKNHADRSRVDFYRQRALHALAVSASRMDGNR